MRNHLMLTILLSLLVALPPARAQKAKIKKAKAQIAALNYVAAVDLLLPLAEDEKYPEAVFLLADVFRKQRSYARAATWYQRACERTDAPPHSWYYYGMMLLHLNRCTEAQEKFDHYLRLEEHDLRRDNLLQACTTRGQLLTLYREEIEVKALNFNSVLSDIGPAFYGNSLVFGSVRRPDFEEDTQDNRPFYDLYIVDELEGPFQFSRPRPFSSRLNSSVHEAIVTFNADGSEIYFTRNRGGERPRKGLQRAGLEIVYAATDGGDRWGSLRSLPFNSDRYSVAHPSLSPDGSRLYFSSDMPGGYGGKDLYVSLWENDHWKKPVNLGPLINTEGDELYPFYHTSGKLYFSSDGQFGLGGQDIFYAEPNGPGEWSSVFNVGAPINTPDDDYGIIVAADGSYGYFTSNRAEGIGQDDIYGFRLIEKEPQPAIISLHFIDAQSGNPIPNTRISQCDLLTPRSGPGESSFQFSLLPEECCDLLIEAEGYEGRQINICASTANPDQMQRILLQPLPPEQAADVHKSLSGLVLNLLDEKPVEGASILLIPVDRGAEKRILSAEDGSFPLTLPADRCVQLRIEKDDFFIYRTTEPLCTDSEGHLLGASTFYLQPYKRKPSYDQSANAKDVLSDFAPGDPKLESEESISFLLEVYYHTGRTSVQAASVPELKKLLDLLEDNPRLIVEISAHTDSRGTATFNQRLSQRRADNIVRYLLSKGIHPDRLVARGYGESLPVNGCIDGVECSEAEHQLNRRTTFKVVGILTEQD